MLININGESAAKLAWVIKPACSLLALYLAQKWLLRYKTPTSAKTYKTPTSAKTPVRGIPEDDIRVCGLSPCGSSFSSLVTDASPFVTKLETWLRLAGLPYTKVLFNLQEAPKAKAPYIKHGSNVVGDSSLIIQYLRNTYGSQIKIAQLPDDPQLQITAHLLQRTLEEHLFFGLVYFRWLWNDAQNVDAMTRGGYFATIPKAALPLTVPLVLKYISKLCQAQGLARHCPEEILQLLREDLGAVSGLLGNKRYMLGDKMYDIDAAAFGMLEGCLYCRMEDPLPALVEEFPNLVAYVDRIREEVWGVCRTDE